MGRTSRARSGIKNATHKLAFSMPERQQRAEAEQILATYPNRIEQARAEVQIHPKGTPKQHQKKIELGILKCQIEQATQRLQVFADRQAKIDDLLRQIGKLQDDLARPNDAWRDWKNFDLNAALPR